MRINDFADMRRYTHERLQSIDLPQYSLEYDMLVSEVAGDVLDTLKNEGWRWGEECDIRDEVFWDIVSKYEVEGEG